MNLLSVIKLLTCQRKTFHFFSSFREEKWVRASARYSAAGGGQPAALLAPASSKHTPHGSETPGACGNRRFFDCAPWLLLSKTHPLLWAAFWFVDYVGYVSRPAREKPTQGHNGAHGVRRVANDAEDANYGTRIFASFASSSSPSSLFSFWRNSTDTMRVPLLRKLSKYTPQSSRS